MQLHVFSFSFTAHAHHTVSRAFDTPPHLMVDYAWRSLPLEQLQIIEQHLDFVFNDLISRIKQAGDRERQATDCSSYYAAQDEQEALVRRCELVIPEMAAVMAEQERREMRELELWRLRSILTDAISPW